MPVYALELYPLRFPSLSCNVDNLSSFLAGIQKFAVHSKDSHSFKIYLVLVYIGYYFDLLTV